MIRGVLVALAAACVLVASAPPSSAGGLRTSIVDPDAFGGGAADAAFQRAAEVGTTMVKLHVEWRAVAPAVEPSLWDPTAPSDPNYQSWPYYDAQVRRAKEHGLEPIMYIHHAPDWAEVNGASKDGTLWDGTVRPNAVAFGAFVRALARRYSGRFPEGCDPATTDPVTACLPRVRYWMAWNEPNRDYFLSPQYDARGRMVSAMRYRAMVRQFASAVHGVAAELALSKRNVVIAGGLAPHGRRGKPAPLAFMRRMLCMSPPPHRRTCDLRENPIPFDVWSHHPYTSGSPTHSAYREDDVSLGDLPEMRRLLMAAAAAGQITVRRPAFWVTEFSWDSNLPDPKALPSKLHARWTSEALYRMWANGVSVVTWFRLVDDPLSVSPYQSGFYGTDGVKKRSFQAFRFPVVAFPRKTGVYVWGQTPAGTPGQLVIQIRPHRVWKRLATVTSGRSGIFSGTFRTPYRKGLVRAKLVTTSELSLPFSLAAVRDRYVNPFGCGGEIPC